MILPSINTKRLFLRPLRKSDASQIFEYAKHEKVGIPAGWLPHVSMRDTDEYIEMVLERRKQGHPGPWMIIHKADKKIIGTIEIHSFKRYKGELGFVLHPDYWRQGIMTEAAKAVMIVALEKFKMRRLSYMHFLSNIASKALRETLHFQVEGLKRKGFQHANGEIMDEIVASFTDDDYFFHYEMMFKDFKATIEIENSH